MKTYDYEHFEKFIEKSWVKKAYLEVRYFIKRVIRFIRRMVKLTPIVWKSHDFDSEYAVEYFIFKLERIAEYFESDKAVATNSKYNAGRIRTVIKILKRISDDYYEVYFWNQVEKEYGPKDFEFIPIEGSESFEINWKYNSDKYTPEEIDEAYREATIKGYELQEKANRVVWKMIERDIWKWRD